MTDYGHGCSEDPTVSCTLHNLHCGYPKCAKGKRDEAAKLEKLKSRMPSGGDLKWITFEPGDPCDTWEEQSWRWHREAMAQRSRANNLEDELKQMTSERNYHEADAALIRKEDDVEIAGLNRALELAQKAGDAKVPRDWYSTIEALREENHKLRSERSNNDK